VRKLVAALTERFTPDSVNLVVAHLHVLGGVPGGGERAAHTAIEYAVSATAFPPTAHYVALGHLHRPQRIEAPCPVRYCGSPLQLDFGESGDAKSVTVIDAAPGTPAKTEEVPLRSGRRLRTVRGTLDDLAALASGRVALGEAEWLKVVVHATPRIGLADEIRALFPDTVDVVVEEPPARGERGPTAADSSRSRGLDARSPRDLFAAYLAEQDIEDEALTALFDRLLDEAVPA
jgi:exonuclease SbcD